MKAMIKPAASVVPYMAGILNWTVLEMELEGHK